MRVLIIGGTGFIGPYVVRRLIAEGCDVAVFNRGQTMADLPASVLNIAGDRQQLESFNAEFKRFAPHVVLDVFPYLERDARTLMQTFRGLAQRVVAISSMDVYRAYGRLLHLENGPAEAAPFNEESPLRTSLYPYRKMAQGPDDLAYNYDKILVEKVVMSDEDLPGTIMRLPKVYGPGDKQHHVFEYLKRMDDGRPAILLEEGKAQWRWTRGYVEDVAAGITLAVTHERAARRIYNIGEAEALTEAEWVRSIGHAAGWDGQIITVPTNLLPAHLAEPYDWQHHLAADTCRVRAELSYRESCSRGKALQRTLGWERAHPPDIDQQRFDYAAEDTVLAVIGKGTQSTPILAKS